MNGLVAKFLLGRGLSAAQEVTAKAVRHGMTALGGYVVAHGLATDAEAATVTGAAVIVAGIVLSLARTFLSKYVAA